MERQDKNLAFMLQYENVAWYEDGQVRILDRRVYPWKVEYVTCNNVQEVAQAITDMVTQCGGPYTAATMGMALAVDQAKREGKDVVEFCKEAAYTLSHARPTTTQRMQVLTGESFALIEQAVKEGKDPLEAAFNYAIDNINRSYARVGKVAEHLVSMFPDKGVVMTQCFAESILGMMSLEIQRQKKEIRFICPETRPYLQGARLTASVLSDMGNDVHVITDNMPGYIMQAGKSGRVHLRCGCDLHGWVCREQDRHLPDCIGFPLLGHPIFCHGYTQSETPDHRHRSILKNAIMTL